MLNYLYGTAWKEDLTTECVFNALIAGYRAIDTANQRKHYYEEGVGSALVRAYAELDIKRQDLFLQTKFTYIRGQDHRLPYDLNASYTNQVEQSFASSLEHLKTDYLDSYVLHGPSTGRGLTDTDWETWEAMEGIQRRGGAKFLGVSNVNFEQLEELYQKSSVKPSFVQNRCYAEMLWDKEIRDFCTQNKIQYQGFSLLTANAKYLGGRMSQPEGRNVPQFEFSNQASELIGTLTAEYKKDVQQIIFRFCQQVGMIPIVGTRSLAHMKSNLQITDFSLTAPQLEQIENIAIRS